MRFFQRNPFVLLLIPTILGILVGHYVTCVWLVVSCTLVLVASCFLGYVWSRIRSNQWIVWACLVALFSLSYARSYLSEQNANFLLLDQPITYELQITQIPQLKPRSVQLRAQLLSRWDSTESVPVSGRVQLTLPCDSVSKKLKKGDILVARTKITWFNRGNPSVSNYADYLRSMGYVGQAFLEKRDYYVRTYQPVRSLTSWAEDCQQWVVHRLERAHLPNQEQAVLAALLVGDRSDLDAATKQSFSVAGAMHVLAVSGLHVGIVYAILWAFLTGWGYWKPLYEERRRRIVNTILIIVFLWGYAFITGLSPSVMRAALMFSLFAIGKFLERPHLPYNTLAASAFILLWIDPFMLRQVGFQLSYAAVTSLFCVQPMLRQLLPRIGNPVLRYMWDLLTVSIAAQIGTLPLTLYYFAQTSNYFALTNLLVIPLAGVIIYVVLIYLVFSPFSLSVWIAKILHYCLWIMTHSIDLIEHFHGSTTTLPITAWMAFCLYGMVGGVLIAIRCKRAQYLLVVACFIAAFFMGYAGEQKRYSERDEWHIYSSNPIVLQHIQGFEQDILTTDSMAACRLVRRIQKPLCLREPHIMLFPEHPSIALFSYYGQSFLLINDSILGGQVSSYDPAIHAYVGHCEPQPVDYLFLGQIGRTYVDDIFRFSKPNHVILLECLPSYKSKKVREYCEQHKIQVTDLRYQSGSLDIHFGQ